MYDVVLMDVHMPVLDGVEASRRIMAAYGPADRPRIVALSADTLKCLHERCRGAGIAEFICKPFRVEDLQRVFRVARTLPRVRGPAPQPQPAGALQQPPPATLAATF